MWKVLDGLRGSKVAMVRHFGRYTIVRLDMGRGMIGRVVMRGRYSTLEQAMEHLILKLPCRTSVSVSYRAGYDKSHGI